MVDDEFYGGEYEIEKEGGFIEKIKKIFIPDGEHLIIEKEQGGIE